MTLIYREEKGMPLTVSEMDGNFRDLDKRLQKLEADEPRKGPSFHVEAEGHILIFKDPFGEIIGKCPLPIPSEGK